MVVYTTCACDLFHVGHLNLLRRAKELGDILVVGVATDKFMVTYKGKPVMPFEQRQQIVAALECVDYVVPHESFIDYRAIVEYGVNIRVVGPEYGKYQGQDMIRRELIRRGVEYVVLPRTPDISTTKIKEDCCEKLVRSDVCPCITCDRLSGS